MVNTLHVPKVWGTYTDTFLMLGLARLLYIVQLQLYNRKKIDVVDAGSSYLLKVDNALDLDEVANQLSYESFLSPVKGRKTESISGLDWADIDFFDTQKNTEIRNRWKEFQRQRRQQKIALSQEDTPSFPDPRTQNGVVLTSMRHDRNHNKLWKAECDVKKEFGPLVAAILKVFSRDHVLGNQTIFDEIAKDFKAVTGKKIPAKVSAVKIFTPTSVLGVNRLKADTNKTGSNSKESWMLLWLVAAGLFEFGFSERVKVADSTYDWRVLSLQPKQINLSSYRDALDVLRKIRLPSGGFGIARFDSEVVLSFSSELLKYHPASVAGKPLSRRSRSPSLKELVSGFSGAHFGPKGKVYGVQSIFSLGIPDWIRPTNAADVKAYRKLLDEHLALVRSLDEIQGELLSAYRNFITGNDLNQFFRFNRSYSEYIVRQIANPKAKYQPRQFSTEGLDIMARSFDKDRPISDITENSGFQRIARAINSSTVYAGKIQTEEGQRELPWQRTYGLAQRLGNQAGSKKDFVTELTAFLTNYGNENLRISEQLQKDGKSLKRVSITNVDLEQFLGLLDEFPCSLVANLLLAYGYARWKKPLKEESKDTPTVEDNT